MYLFLELIEKFNHEFEFLIKTLVVVNEDTLINAYKLFKNKFEAIINEIDTSFSNDYKPSYKIKRKLLLIILFKSKYRNQCDKILYEFINRYYCDKNIIFDLLLDYSNEFGKYIHFSDIDNYKEFVEYSLELRKYKKTLDYMDTDIIQLQILDEKKK